MKTLLRRLGPIRLRASDVADESKWETVGFREADLRPLRRRLEFRRYIRPSAQQVRRNSDGHLLRSDRDIGPAGKEIVQWAGRETEQHAESVCCLSSRTFNSGSRPRWRQERSPPDASRSVAVPDWNLARAIFSAFFDASTLSRAMATAFRCSGSARTCSRHRPLR